MWRSKSGPLWFGEELVPVVHGRAHARRGLPLSRQRPRRAWEGPVGPRGQADAAQALFAGFCFLRLCLRRKLSPFISRSRSFPGYGRGGSGGPATPPSATSVKQSGPRSRGMTTWAVATGRKWISAGGHSLGPDHCRDQPSVRTVAPGDGCFGIRLAATSSTRLIRIRPVRPRTSAAIATIDWSSSVAPRTPVSRPPTRPPRPRRPGDHAPASPATCAAKPADNSRMRCRPRTDPVLLVGHVPHRLEPKAQWLSTSKIVPAVTDV